MSGSCRSGSVTGSACETTGTAAILPREGHQDPFATPQRLAELRPGTGHEPVSVCSGKLEASLPGRPLRLESEQRAEEFLRLAAAGASLDVAARDAKVEPVRALRLVSEPDFWPRVYELRNGTAA